MATSKKNQFFEVSIKFINNLGIYKGNSLGVALTICFIKELFLFHDMRDDISFNSNIIATDSLNEDGQIKRVGEEIIRSKIITAFYSLSNKFIVPFNDLDFAEEQVFELNNNYPKRKIEIIPVRNISELIEEI